MKQQPLNKLILSTLLCFLPVVSFGQDVLGPATATASRSGLTVNGNLVSYAVGLDSLNLGRKLKDIVARMPLVNFDKEREVITVGGSENIYILFNGRRSLSLNKSNFAYMSELLTGGQVESIEIDTSPEGPYRNYSAVINIKTTGEGADFVSGKLGLLGSTKQKVSPSAGLTTKLGRLTTETSYSFGWLDEKETITSTKGQFGGKTVYESADTLDPRKGLNHNADLKMSYDLSAKDVVFIDGSLVLSDNDTYSSSMSRTGGAENHVSGRNSLSSNDIKAGAAYQHIFDNGFPKMLTTQYSFSQGKVDNHYGATSANNGTTSRQHIASVDYLHSIDFRNMWDVNTALFSRTYESTVNRVSVLHHEQNVFQAKANGRWGLKKVMLSGEADFEQTVDKAQFGAENNSMRDNYGTIDFNLRANWFIRAGHSLTGSVSKSIFRPDIKYRNPYEDNSVAGVITVGNPELKNQKSWNGMLLYSIMKGMKFSTRFVLSCFKTWDGIYSTSTYREDGMIVNSFENGVVSDKIMGSIGIMWRPVDALNINLTYRLARFSYSGACGNTAFLDHFAYMYASYSPWKGGEFTLNSSLINPYTGLYDATQAERMHYYINGAVSYSQQLGKHFNVSLFVDNPWSRNTRRTFDYNSSGTHFIAESIKPERFVGAQIRYTFGKFRGMAGRNSREIVDVDRTRQQ